MTDAERKEIETIRRLSLGVFKAASRLLNDCEEDVEQKSSSNPTARECGSSSSGQDSFAIIE